MCHLLYVAVINTMTKFNWREERVYLAATSTSQSIKGNGSRNLGVELTQIPWGLLLTRSPHSSLSLLSYIICGYLDGMWWVAPIHSRMDPHINHLSRKTTDMPTSQPEQTLLTCGFLLPGDSSLCGVDKNLAAH